MSSCLVLQAKDKLYIGADTSSSVFIGEKLYRLNNNTKKLFLLDDNTVLYCAGNNSIANEVARYITSIYCRDDFSLTALKNWLIEKYPYKNKDKTIYDVEILIATFKNNRTIVYQMSQYKNYDIVSFEVSDAGVQILSAGIKNAECMSFAENELLNKSGVKSIFRTTFNNLSCNYIGGCLDLYEITKNGAIKIFDNEKINEHGIQYVHDVFNGLSVSLNAEVLVSKLVMSENLWIENNSGNYKFNDNGFTATNGNNTIKIQPNNSGELFSIYKGLNKQVYINSSGDVEFAGTLKSASGQFSGLLSGGSINLGNGVFTVDKNGNMNSSSARISGEVNASSGTIGGWNINSDSLSSSNNSVFLSSDGTISGATITGATITGATITGANGKFTKGFEVNLPSTLIGGVADGNYMISFNSDGLFLGMKYYDETQKGITISDNSINIDCSDGKNGCCVYINNETPATINDIPDLSDYATKNDISGFITGINVSLTNKSGTSGYTKNYFLHVSGAGNTASVNAAQIHVSDRRLKEFITDAQDISRFYMLLNPVHFKYKYNVEGVDGHWHYGFIAQDVKQAFIDAGIESYNEALVGHDVDNDVWLLDKDELHAMHVQMIQKQYQEIEFLKKEFTSLEQKVNQLIN